MAGHEASLLHLEKDLEVEDDISMLSDKVMKELLVPHQVCTNGVTGVAMVMQVTFPREHAGKTFRAATVRTASS